MSSLAMVEQGALNTQQVAAVLREAIDDLRLTIDSLEPIDDDVLTLLATLRYRLGRRLEAAGLRLEWRVTDTPPLPWLNPTSSLQILRILQETLTNTLKHARASVITVVTQTDAAEVQIEITDNGCGFDVEATRRTSPGRGMQNIARRAAALDARIIITSEPGTTRVTLCLPRARTVR